MDTGLSAKVWCMEFVSDGPVLTRPRRDIGVTRQPRWKVEVIDGMLECSQCRESKLTDDFYKKNTRTGFSAACRSCTQGSIARARAEDNRPFRSKALKSAYNITLEQYEEMLEEQGGVCAVCKRPEEMERNGVPLNFAVDHDHSCCPGKTSCGQCIRGLVCWFCNKTLAGIDRVGSVDPFASYLAKRE